MNDGSTEGRAKITIERRGHILLIGINRTYIYNRVDPEAYHALAKVYYDYDHDSSLRAAVLFGHGENFSRGVDVDAFTELAKTGKPTALVEGELDPLGKIKRLSKPLIVVAYGDTWNMGHELLLTADIRIAAADVRFGQDENTHGRFPGGGATVRFVREAGWANAMRYLLTGDHWGADEARRVAALLENSARRTEHQPPTLVIAAQGEYRTPAALQGRPRSWMPARQSGTARCPSKKSRDRPPDGRAAPLKSFVYPRDPYAAPRHRREVGQNLSQNSRPNAALCATRGAAGRMQAATSIPDSREGRYRRRDPAARITQRVEGFVHYEDPAIVRVVGR